jgi:outer membrane protein TolC
VAKQAQVSRKEALVRLLGLDASQAGQLQLPERLPELPELALSAQDMASAAGRQRWDIQMAKAELEMAARAQGLTDITSWLDVELTVISGKVTGNDAVTQRRGAEIGVKLPVFDSGDMQRAQMNALTLSAANRLQATARDAASSVRENYAAYLAAYDIARQYRDDVLPLQQRIADENILRYNAMQISVFDLLADAASHNAAVMSAIEAQQQFWLSEAALQATLVGRPLANSLSADVRNNSSSAAH